MRVSKYKQALTLRNEITYQTSKKNSLPKHEKVWMRYFKTKWNYQQFCHVIIMMRLYDCIMLIRRGQVD